MKNKIINQDTVLLSLEKYNELIEDQKKLNDFKMANTIAEFYPYRGYHPIYRTNDAAVAQIINELEKKHTKLSEMCYENELLKDKIKRFIDNFKIKSIFGICIIKLKTINNLIKDLNEKQV